MADFRQMGGIPEGYDQLLNSARQQLVRLPDGTLTLAPQFGQATSLDEIYRGMYPVTPPAPTAPLISRSVSTVPVDMNGNPIVTSSTGPGFSAPTAGATMAEQRSGSRPAVTIGSQPAGTVAMPPGARPASVNQAFAQMNRPPDIIQNIPPPSLPSAQPTIDATNPIDISRLGLTTSPFATVPAVAAIEQAAPPSGSFPMPRPLPLGFGPLAANPPASIPLTALTGPTGAPSIPLPRNRPAPPVRTGTLGPITFQRGDTVSQLARDRGMTVKSFADLFGIKDPNKIRAGDTVMPSVPQPRMRPPSLGGGSTTPRNSGRWEGVLDEFGMII